VYGTIVSAWERKGGYLTLKLEIPVNTTATISLPFADLASVTESGIHAGAAHGVLSLPDTDGVVRLNVGSGGYEIRYPYAL
jgi:alpha-L-rhamnosidase